MKWICFNEINRRATPNRSAHGHIDNGFTTTILTNSLILTASYLFDSWQSEIWIVYQQWAVSWRSAQS